MDSHSQNNLMSMRLMHHFADLRKILCFAIIYLMVMQVMGCSWFRKPEERETARALAEKGMEDYNDGDYRAAILSFQNLRDWYPFSQYAILAELKLGDAYYHRKEYEEAIVAYESFERLHPKNEATPYVVYQIGRCYFDRIQTIDRDQTMAREALKAFERLIRTYPDSPYANKAEEHIRICNKNLAEHDFYVGMFYYKSKYYKAALERFKSVVTSYPDLGIHQKALKYIALCQEKLDNAALGEN
jgi:outer membrane protein assembly factor BamD